MAQKERPADNNNVIRKKITSLDLEKLEVARLNCDIEPRSKPSDLFEKLQEKRRIRHENVLRQLAKSLHEINTRTEKGISLSSLELKAQSKDFQKKLKAILKSIDTLEVASYSATVFEGFQNKANAFKAEQQKLINEFYDDLIAFEDNRATENAKLLHVACEEIRKIGYLLPYDCQAFVEEETLKMNELSLNNRRCYEDLKLTLTLVAEQTFKSFSDKVLCIREKWVQYKAHKSHYDKPNEPEERPSRVGPKTYTRLELKGEELPFYTRKNSMYCSCRAEDWIKNVEKILAILFDYGKNLIQFYKNVVKAIYNGFNTGVGEIKIAMNVIENIVIEERVIKPLAIGVQSFQAKDIEELEIQWQNSLEEIRNQMKYVTEFVRDLGSLWDRHSERLCESKNLILKALEKEEQNNEPILQELELQLNLSLDALRQEHILSKLEKDYETVVATLEDLKAKYETMYLEDVSILQDFYKIMDLEADVLSADIQEYLYESNTVKFMQSYSGQFRLLREMEYEGKSIYREMKSCSQQIQHLRFWKQGVWTALETVSGRLREILRPRADRWIKSKIEVLAEKKSIQLELLDRRFQRIQVEIYERRMAEIKAHQEMFDKHKEKIGLILKKAKEEFQNLIANELKTLNYVRENLMEVERNAKLENLPGVIRGNQKMLERKKEELEKDIQQEFERFRAYCETRMSDAQQINVKFMKSIKLFHENGNYSSEEGKAFINMLEAVDKEICTELKSTVRDSSKSESEMIKKVSEFFNPVIVLFDSLYEETLFNQEIHQRLENFTTHIQESVKILKVDSHFFNEHYYCIRKFVENPSDVLKVSEEQLWNFLIQLLYKNMSNLLYPLNLPETPAPKDEEDNKEESRGGESTKPCCCAGKYPINFTNSKNFIFRKSEKPVLSCKNFGSELFYCKTLRADDGTFMGTMCKNFSEEFNFFQNAACNFYKKIQGRKIVREDLLPDNYDSFIQRILTKFYHYNIQIQELWLQILFNFLQVLGEIKLLANNFVKKKVEDYKDSALRALKNYETNFKDCTESQNRENSQELEDLDKKLLPLHGYPDNVFLLHELEETVVGRIAKQTVRWENALKSFKSQLKCFRVHHVQEKHEINKIELQYTKLRDTIFVEDLGRILLDELLNICNNGGFCIERSSKDHMAFTKQPGNDTSGSRTLVEEGIPEEDDLHITPEKFHSPQGNIEKLKQILERERFSGIQLPTCPTSPADSYNSTLEENLELCQEKLNILLHIIDFQECAFGAIDELQHYIRYLKTSAETQEKFHEEEIFKWLNKWKFNVKKILKLYSVKNEENPCIMKELKNGEYSTSRIFFLHNLNLMHFKKQTREPRIIKL